MGPSSREVLETISGFDGRKTVFAESEVATAIAEALRALEQNGKVRKEEDRAEHIAFSLTPQAKDQPIYFGPIAILRADDGSTREFPSLKSITAFMLEYWAGRGEEVTHSVLRMRYADLVWVLSKPVIRQAPSVSMAHAAIDNALDAVAIDDPEHEVERMRWVDRALDIALSIRDIQWIIRARDTMIDLEDRIAEDGRTGLWGFCFDTLLDNKNVPMSDQLRQKIVRDMENRLARVDGQHQKELDPHAVEAAATRLVAYYKRIGDQLSTARVLCVYRDSFLRAVEGADPLLAQHWLRKAYEVLTAHGLAVETEEVVRRLRDHGAKAVGSLKPICASIDISPEEVQTFINDITGGTLEEALRKWT